VGDQPGDEVLGGFFDVAVPATIGQHEILIRRHGSIPPARYTIGSPDLKKN
jgi:hypothetical protein